MGQKMTPRDPERIYLVDIYYYVSRVVRVVNLCQIKMIEV